MKLEIPFSSNGMISTILSLDKDWQESTKSVLIQQFLWGYNLQLSYARMLKKEMDYLTFLESSEETDIAGFSYSGALLGLGFWGEGAYFLPTESDEYLQGIVGLDYTLDSGLYLMSEYYYNGSGEKDKADYDFNDWMNLYTDGTNLAQKYLYLGESATVKELAEWANYVIINLDDNSISYNPWINVSLSDDVVLDVYAIIALGDDDAEFTQFENSLAARLKVYF